MKFDKYRHPELLALLASAILKFTLMDWLGMRVFYIFGICLIWFLYVYFRHKNDNNVHKEWGFQKEHFNQAFLRLMPLIVTGIVLSLLIGKVNGNVTTTWHILPIILLYPVWGLFQQYLMLGLIARKMMNSRRIRFNPATVVVLTSILFSLVHSPDLLLMVITFVMEIVFVIVYMKWRNLWAIGLAHGWIATFLLYYVFGRDLWSELFLWFQNG